MNIVKGKIKRPQKVVVYGPEGIGKTTLGSAFPKALLIDVEHGSGHLDCDRIDVVDWSDFCETLEQLFADHASHDYKTLVIDTADWLEKLAIEYICNKYKLGGIEEMGFGKGYVYVNEEMIKGLSLLDQLRNVGFNVVMIAHSQVQKRELPGSQGAFDRYELKCSKRVTALLKEWADAVLFLNYKIIVEEGSDGKHRARGGTERLLMTEHTAAYDAKNRWGLEPEIKVGGFDNPIPAEMLAHLAESEPVAKKETKEKGTTEKKELSELQKLMKKHGLTGEDIKAVLKKQGVKSITKKVEAKLVEQFDKVVEISAKLKG